MKKQRITRQLLALLVVLGGLAPVFAQTPLSNQNNLLALATASYKEKLALPATPKDTNNPFFGCVDNFHLGFGTGGIGCSSPALPSGAYANDTPVPLGRVSLSGGGGGGGSITYYPYTISSSGTAISRGSYSEAPDLRYEFVDPQDGGDGYKTVPTGAMMGDFPAAVYSQTSSEDLDCDIFGNMSTSVLMVECKKCNSANTLLKLGHPSGQSLRLGSPVSISSRTTAGAVVPVASRYSPGGSFFVTGSVTLTPPIVSPLANCTNARKTKQQYQQITQPETVALNIYPNPAQRNTTLQIHLPQTEDLTVEVFDMNGKAQRTLLVGKRFPEGNNQIPLDLSSLVAGQYIVKVTSSLSNIKVSQVIIKQ
ncbi:T9SS type A sorting domain-containing protein [Microscilla marina]|uniref:Secretion system C-terminal sorting domain-containing protein n=1 Tax=Microscilla marina ATCC 23134 TaxID=313606 RepID=A1ZQM5_MICM2|nr:T9SS type A sorting domain-containing protein [Microscilla marina]EAY27397.1 hypothetical protein M23134_08349 [Microscilla marina ATCC 23134]